MEYTFRNLPGREPCTIRLSDTGLSIVCSTTTATISYHRIRKLYIERRGDSHFRTWVFSNEREPVCISNAPISSDQPIEEQSRAYSTFIRVLHFHLKDHPGIEYAVKPLTSWWEMLLASAVISFAISFLADYGGVKIAAPLITGTGLAALSGLLILAVRITHKRYQYTPTDIPLEFLP